MLHQSHIFQHGKYILCIMSRLVQLLYDNVWYVILSGYVCLFIVSLIEHHFFSELHQHVFSDSTTHLSITWFEIYNIQIRKWISSSKPFPFTDLQSHIFWMLFLFARYYYLRAFLISWYSTITAVTWWTVKHYVCSM